MNKEPHFFDQDDSCHWYLIPASKQELWTELNYEGDAYEDPRWDFDKYRIEYPGEFIVLIVDRVNQHD